MNYEETDVSKYPDGFNKIVELIKNDEELKDISDPAAFLHGLLDFESKT